MATSKKYKKEEIRREIRAVRASLTKEEEQFWNEQLFSCISQMPELLRSPYVYCYVSCNHEADTRRILEFFWEQRIQTVVPRVSGPGQMDFYMIRSFADLIPGRMGILEPGNGCIKAEDKRGAVITPGLAFDRQGGRIGYGGGYYDRFFAREPEHLRIGIAYPFQLYERLPADEYDETLDYLIAAGERKGNIYEFDRNRKAGKGSIETS